MKSNVFSFTLVAFVGLLTLSVQAQLLKDNGFYFDERGRFGQQVRSSPETVMQLAVDGHAWAQFELGVRYADGRGVEQSDAEAVKWFCRAAEQGNAGAQNALGFMYYRGRGTVL